MGQREQLGELPCIYFCRKPALQSPTFSAIRTEGLHFDHLIAENRHVRMRVSSGIVAMALICALAPGLAQVEG